MALSAYHQSQATEHAADSAANATQNAANTAAQTQKDTLAQQANLSAPYRGLGEAAIPQLMSLLGLGGGGSGGGWTMAPDGTMKQVSTGGAADPTAALRSTPGYQFTLSEGLNAGKNQAAAMGMGLSGNTLEALTKFGAGLADQTYENAVNNDFRAVGMGQAAAAGQAQNAGQAANTLSSIFTNQGNNIANIGLANAAAQNQIQTNFNNNTQQTLTALAFM